MSDTFNKSDVRLKPSAPGLPWALAVPFLFLLGVALYFVWDNFSNVEFDKVSQHSSYELFCNEVVPILNRRCSTCHDASADQYYHLKKTADIHKLFRWEVDSSGQIRTPLQRKNAYDECRDKINYHNDPLVSPLARFGLASVYSGAIHPEVFESPEDIDFKTLLNWVSLEIENKSEQVNLLETDSERFFAKKITPILIRKSCFGCHGPLAFNDLNLDPGIPILEGKFTPDMHRRNRQAMLGAVTRLVHLSGDIEQSKQLVKNIPIEEGGIVHLGGNHFFKKGDPDYQTMVKWLKLEAETARNRTGAELGKMQGILFVRRPNARPARFFEDREFLPGADIFWLHNGIEKNLTASLHPNQPADIRSPDISYDAKKVVFTMRRNVEEPFNIWELDLQSPVARQITFSDNSNIHYMDPLYVPDPTDTEGNDLSRAHLVFTSNLARQYCQSSPDWILGEADGGDVNTIIDLQRFEREGTFDGRTVRIVRGTNQGQERKILKHESGRILIDRPFEFPCDSNTHYIINVEPRSSPQFDAYRMPIPEPGKEEEVFKNTLKRMTYSVSQIRRPTMRSSGEIMFTALRSGWQDGRPFFNGALFRTHIDGSNFHTHNGNRSAIPIFADDREMPNGLEIRIGRDADSYWGGMLILSDHQFGPNIESDNPLDNLDHPYKDGKPKSSKIRFVPGWISLDRQVTSGGVSNGGAYRDPYPMPDGSILVSYAKGPIDLASPDANPNFDIVKLIPDPSFQSEDGFKEGKYRREVIVSSDDSELWARPVCPRLKEPTRKVLKTEHSLYGPPRTANGISSYSKDMPAVLRVYDLILLDAFFEQITPVGRKHLASEACSTCGQVTDDIHQVKYARIIGAEPHNKGETEELRRFIIAEVPLKPDGSFYAQVTSGVSFDIQSLNSMKMALRSPNRWLYCQPGEVHALSTPRELFVQSCGGCHGSLTGAVEDILRRPDAVTAASRTQAIWDNEKQTYHFPDNYTSTGAPQIITVDFSDDIVPILNSNCMDCHSGKKAAARLDLSPDKAFAALRPFVEHKGASAIQSYLIEKLSGKELHSPRALQDESPHPSSNPLTHEELLTLIRWIDLGATRHGGKVK